MRVKTGDELHLFDGKGNSYHCKIENIAKDKISGQVISKEQSYKAKVVLNVYQAVPKGERMDWLVEKLSELGIASLYPVITDRSGIKEISESKISRWERLSLSASKQCGRPDIMKIEKPLSFSDAAGKVLKDALSIIPWEGSETKFEFDIKNIKEANIFIGPEGGFTVQEIELAQKKSIIPVSLGKRILRVETASILASILLLNAFDEFQT
jgi:16S rRNA (uracil1498-N3)-methyltransferase